MSRVKAITMNPLVQSLMIRGVVLVALCILVSGCTAGASQWENTYTSAPVKTSSDAIGYIGW